MLDGKCLSSTQQVQILSVLFHFREYRLVSLTPIRVKIHYEPTTFSIRLDEYVVAYSITDGIVESTATKDEAVTVADSSVPIKQFQRMSN